MKQRVTVSLAEELVEALDNAPGNSRSDKVERLLHEALAVRSHRRWLSELQAFYSAPNTKDRREDLDWQALAAEAFERSD